MTKKQLRELCDSLDDDVEIEIGFVHEEENGKNKKIIIITDCYHRLEL